MRVYLPIPRVWITLPLCSRGACGESAVEGKVSCKRHLDQHSTNAKLGARRRRRARVRAKMPVAVVGRLGAAYRCGKCGELGHNRRGCEEP